MATIRRRRPFMGRGMHMVRRPRRQRGGRMHLHATTLSKRQRIVETNTKDERFVWSSFVRYDGSYS